jgi:hypothetical protein
MPRRTRPRCRGPAGPGEPPPLRAPDVAAPAPEGWQVRVVQPAGALKQYRCPGCEQEIRPGTKHVVAWPEHDPEARRHWHTPCWARSQRPRLAPRGPHRAPDASIPPPRGVGGGR